MPQPGDIWRSKGGLKLIVEDVSADGVLASCQHGGRAWRHTPLDAFLAKHTYVGHDEQLLWICECGTANARKIDRKTTCRSCQRWTRVHHEHAGVREAWKAGLIPEASP